MIVVSDTSPLTNLFQIGRLQLVHELFDDVVIPGAVAAEIEFLEHNREILTQNPWIRLVEVKDRTLLRDLTENIDSGEAEAIVLAIQLNADAILIDETLGRSEAIRLGLDVTGAVGVLIRAKRKGLIAEVKPEIDRLTGEAGFWLHPAFVAEALHSVGED